MSKLISIKKVTLWKNSNSETHESELRTFKDSLSVFSFKYFSHLESWTFQRLYVNPEYTITVYIVNIL